MAEVFDEFYAAPVVRPRPVPDTQLALKILSKKQWALERLGFPGFRPGQEEVFNLLAFQQDTIFCAPTALGKSASWSMPILAAGWRAVVFCPLIALMNDQVRKCNEEFRVAAAQMSSMQSDAENARAAQRWMAGELVYLYVAPERMQNDWFIKAMRAVSPDVAIIDETHVLSGWGDNFRPAYCRIGQFISENQPRVVFACTATCPRPVEEDVRRVLGLANAQIQFSYQRRTNLDLRSEPWCSDVAMVGRIEEVLKETDGSVVVYCGTQKATEETCGLLNETLERRGASCVYFHGGMLDADKRESLMDFMDGKARVVAATCAFGMGIDKAQPLTAKVLTPRGWKLMGDIEVGDQVIGSDGCATAVQAIHERGVLPAFRVHFSDGASTVCADDHKWAVRTAKQKMRGKDFVVKSLADIRRDLHDTSGNRKHFIPLVGTVQFEKRTETLPVDPYLLGVLLGDGGLTQNVVRFTTGDVWMVEELTRLIPAGLRIRRYSKYDYGIIGIKRNVQNPLRLSLDALGLKGSGAHSKSIPTEYLTADAHAREALLQGLLDTDGSVAGPAKTGVMFVTVSDALRDGVVFLARSLGGTAKTKRKREAWYVFMELPPQVTPFRLPRQAAKYKPRVKYFPRRVMTHIEAEAHQPMRCITVANSDGLYVTDDFIVTHNSNVRAVIHRDYPGSPEDMAQETGRAGRDGLPALCMSYDSGRARNLREMFIRNGHPDKESVIRVFDTLRRCGGSKGVVQMTNKVLSEKVGKGVPEWQVSACLNNLKAAGVIERTKTDERIAWVKFTGGTEDPVFQKWHTNIYKISEHTADGRFIFDIGTLALAGQVSDTTAKNWMRRFHERGLIHYEPPAAGIPTKIIGDLSLVDFDRLKAKADLAWWMLNEVQRYLDTPNNRKHDFFEQYFDYAKRDRQNPAAKLM